MCIYPFWSTQIYHQRSCPSTTQAIRRLRTQVPALVASKVFWGLLLANPLSYLSAASGQANVLIQTSQLIDNFDLNEAMERTAGFNRQVKASRERTL